MNWLTRHRAGGLRSQEAPKSIKQFLEDKMSENDDRKTENNRIGKYKCMQKEYKDTRFNKNKIKMHWGYTQRDAVTVAALYSTAFIYMCIVFDVTCKGLLQHASGLMKISKEVRFLVI